MGATLNIGVNNGNFNAAMKQINAELKNVQTNFTEANTKARLFGTATDQLKAKQTELTSKIELYNKSLQTISTRQGDLASKMDNLKNKQGELAKKVQETQKAYEESVKSTGKNSEETKKLQAELQKVTKEYNANERAIQKAEKEMTTANTKMSESRTHLMECEKELEKVNKQLSSSKINEFGDKVGKAGEKFTKVGNALKPAAVGLTAIGAASTKVGMDFDYAMSDLAATSGATGQDFDKLRDKAKELGATTCKSASDSAAAMKYLALSGQDANQILQTTEPTLKASVAFGEDLARTADLETDSMSALGLSVNDLNHYLDVCGQAQRKSNTTASMLMEAYIECGNSLKAFNVPIEESATVLGIMANQGIKGSQAGNSLNSVLVNLMGISGQSADALAALGITAYDTDGKYKGLHNILEELKVALASCTDEQRDQFTAMIGGKTQMTALQAMLQATGDTYDDLKGKIDQSKGACEEMYQTMQNNDKGSLESFKSAMEACGIAIHDSIKPAIDVVLKSLTYLASGFSKLPQPVITIITIFGGLVIGISGVTLAIGGLLGLLSNAILGFANFRTAISGLNIISTIGTKLTGLGGIITSVFGIAKTTLTTLGTLIMAHPVVAIITAVIAALVLLYQHCEPFRNFVNELWENIKQFGSFLLSWFTELPTNISNLWQSIKDTCSTWWNNIVQFFTESIPQWIESVFNWFMQLPSKIAYALGFALGSIVKWGAECLNWLTTNVPNWINSIGQWFSELPGKIWQWLLDAFNKITEWGGNIINWIVTSVPQWIDSIVNFFTELPSKIWNWLVNTFNKFVEWGGNMISTAKQKMSDCGTAIVDAFKNLPSKMWEIGSNIVNGIKEGIKNAWDSMVGWMGDLCNSFVNGVKDALDIHSPSRVFRDQVGKFIPQGIQVGVESEMPNLNKSIVNELDYTVGLANDSINKINKSKFDSKANDIDYRSKFDEMLKKLEELKELFDITLDGDSIVKKIAPRMSNQLAFNAGRRTF